MTKQEINDYGVRISHASRTELIVIMYEMAVKYIDDGVKELEAGNVELYRVNIKRAKAVINELTSVLDMRQPVSHELRNIYIFINNVFVRADIRKETEELLRVRGMLVRLKEAFTEVSKTDESGPVMQNTQQLYAGLTYSRSSLNEEMYSDINRGYKA
ncbi:MAG: flagellar protein FliS [Butyrivibrio sp.]